MCSFSHMGGMLVFEHVCSFLSMNAHFRAYDVHFQVLSIVSQAKALP